MVMIGNKLLHFLCLFISYINLSQGIIIHKNRDFKISPQSVFVKHIKGTYRYIGSVEIANTGTAYFLNEKGLCCVSNTGSPTEDIARGGITEHLVMRLLAEKASSCGEALEIIQEIISKRIFTSREDGVIFLIADKKQSGLIVEATCSHIEYTKVSGTAARANLFLLPGMKKWEADITNRRGQSSDQRLERAMELLGEQEISVERTRGFSRDTKGTFPICGDRTVSAMTFLLHENPDIPDSVWICVGNPRFSCYLPLSVDMRSVPRFMVDGTLWNISHALEDKDALLDQKEWEEKIKTVSQNGYSEEEITRFAKDVYAYMVELEASST